jgi:hypothetical protein
MCYQGVEDVLSKFNCCLLIVKLFFYIDNVPGRRSLAH